MDRDLPQRDGLDELTAYTLSHGDAEFVHQHVVDAAGAQFADRHTPPIRLAFSLVGLYLHLERGYSGRDVQRVHGHMAARTRTWPTFPLPATRGSMTPADVVRAPEGPDRDAAIEAWCASVWRAYTGARGAVIELLAEHGLR